MTALQEEISYTLVLDSPTVTAIGIFMQFIYSNGAVIELIGQLYHIMST
jgi:hypothetical protein